MRHSNGGGRVIIAGTGTGRRKLLECLEEGENEVNGQFILEGQMVWDQCFIGIRATMG